MLTKREVYFASPGQLNDPYDCRISIRRALEETIEKAGRNGNRKLQEQLERFRKIDHIYEKMERGYEKEVRVLRKVPGAVSFEASELTEIVFGMNMPQPNREALRQLLHEKEWNHVRFREIVRLEGFTVSIEDAAI